MRRDWLIPAVGIVLVVLALVAGLLIAQPWQSPPPAQHFAAVIPNTTSCQFNGEQTATITGGPSTGTWQLVLDGNSSTTLAITAAATDVLTALTSSPISIPATEVNVTGSAGAFTITFAGALLNSVDRMSTTNSFDTGSVVIAVVANDQTNQFQRLVNNFPDNSTLTLPFDSCWEVDSSVHIHSNVNVTINGNGATLIQTVCQGSGAGGGVAPVIFLTEDVGLTITNLSIFGAIGWPHAGCPGNGANNGPAFEKNAGIIVEDETNLTLTGIGIFDTQGDAVILQAAVDFGIPGNPLNTNVTLSNSQINLGNGGYHCLVEEAVGPTPTYPTGGAKIIGNTWRNCPTEAMDFEADLVSTIFGSTGCALPGGMCPLNYAQDNTLISNNIYSNWGKPFFASIQAYGNGVQEQNIQITGNTMHNNGAQSGPGSLFDVEVTPPCCKQNNTTTTSAPNTQVPPQFWTSGWVISNNRMTGGAHSTGSNACDGSPPLGQAMVITGLANSTISNNTFPIDYGNTTGGCPGNPYLAVLDITNTLNLNLTNNQFVGALQFFHGTTGGQGFHHCGNSGGVLNTTTPPFTDSPC